MSKNLHEWLIVVPARLQSTRLPEKPLKDLCGKPLIVRVYEQLNLLTEMGAHVVVATDSDKILQVCKNENINCEITKVDHQSGTDRVHEVAQRYEHRYILNVQGDEPFVNIEDLLSLIEAIEQAEDDSMGTMIHANEDKKSYTNQNIVKAVVSSSNKALYFSRSPIPHYREDRKFRMFWQHVGVYAFTKTILSKFCECEPSELEKAESLEQLRALENDIPICTIVAKKPAIGIDTMEDLEEAREHFIKQKNHNS